MAAETSTEAELRPAAKACQADMIVVEGTDGSGRSTQISLLTEWLEGEGFAVETMGLRRSFSMSWAATREGTSVRSGRTRHQK